MPTAPLGFICAINCKDGRVQVNVPPCGAKIVLVGTGNVQFAQSPPPISVVGVKVIVELPGIIFPWCAPEFV